MFIAMAAAYGATAASVPADPRLAVELLAAHNAERQSVGLRPLAWDAGLAAEADRYAAELAALGDIRHSASHNRKGQGENLWMGTRAAFAPRTMVQDWASEKSYFEPGPFPTTRRGAHWSQVGHYTQIIWPGTTHVGCAIRSGRGNDFLVCRYSPPGNVMGQRVP